MKAILSRIFKPQKPMPNPSPRITEICQWFKSIEQGESIYFAAADACLEARRPLVQETGRLAAELRDNPCPEKYRELARLRAEWAALRDLESDGGLFWMKRDIHTRRAAMHPEAVATIGELVSLARGFIEPRLAEARKADEKTTRELDAREPIISGATRKLESVLKSADLTEEWLAEDNDAGRFWQPASGLCALLEGMTHE